MRSEFSDSGKLTRIAGQGRCVKRTMEKRGRSLASSENTFLHGVGLFLRHVSDNRQFEHLIAVRLDDQDHPDDERS